MSTPRQSEREEFEAWYVADALRQVPDLDIKVEDMRNLRNGDNYGPDRVMLQGKWEGWQARSASLRREEQGEAFSALRELVGAVHYRSAAMAAGNEDRRNFADDRLWKAMDAAAKLLQSNGEQQ